MYGRLRIGSRNWKENTHATGGHNVHYPPPALVESACRIPGHVKWPRTQVHYVQVSVGGYSLIPNVFQMDIEARTSNSAALFAGVLLTVTVEDILWGYPSPLDLRY